MPIRVKVTLTQNPNVNCLFSKINLLCIVVILTCKLRRNLLHKDKDDLNIAILTPIKYSNDH